jgi:hypothetical protein
MALVTLLIQGFVPLLLAAVALFPVTMLVTAPTAARVSAFLRDRFMEEGQAMDRVDTLLASIE